MTVESDTGQLSVAPPSGCNLICKNPPFPAQHNQSEPRGVSEKCQSLSCTHCCSPPPPHRCSVCSHLVRYVQTQTVNNGGEQTTTTEQKHAPPSPATQRRNKKTEEEKQLETKNWTEPERKQGQISEHHFRGGGAAGLSGLFCWTGKNLLDICFTLCFNHKAKMAAVTVTVTACSGVCALKWLNWFRELTFLMLQKGSR